MQSAQLETEPLLLVGDIERRLKATHYWWMAIGELVFLHVQYPNSLQGELADAELIELWGTIAFEANRVYPEIDGEFLQARATTALVAQNVRDFGYTPDDMGSLVPTTIGRATTVTVPVLTSLVIDEFMNNTWGPAS